MPTRIYFLSSGEAAVTPSTWAFSAQIAAPDTFAGVTTPIASAMTSRTGATGTTSPIHRAMGRHVIGPLQAQTISGTVKGQMRGSENNAGANGTLAIAIKIITPAGADRGVLLAATASTGTATPPEFSTSLINRRMQNAAASFAPGLTSQSATAGDYLVIEWGFRAATTTSRNIVLVLGDDSVSDLGENETATAADNPWIEFSGDLLFEAPTGSLLARHRRMMAGMFRGIFRGVN